MASLRSSTAAPRRFPRRAPLLKLLIAILPLTDGLAAAFLDHWRTVCEDFRDHYSYTEHKGVDWTEIFEANRARFESVTSPAAFATNLHESLLVLHDWHVAVQEPGGAWLGYSLPVPRNYPVQFVTHHAAIRYENYRNAGALIHARLTNDAVHLVVPTLDTATFDKISDADLLSLLQSFQAARGLIVDLRHNSGGNELHARRLAAFFVRATTLYGYTRTRAPTEPGGFSPLSARHLEPHAELHLDFPTVVLTGQQCLSSCEWLVLMFREAPNAILMGDRTRGGTGNPVLVSIPELGVNYLRSRWIGYTPEQAIIEDRGIDPAIGLRADWSYDDVARRDLLLEHAMEYVEWRHRTGDARAPINRLTDTDGDGARDTAEFVAATDPLDPASVLRVGIAGPIPTLSWATVGRRAYVVFESASPASPWTAYAAPPNHLPQVELPVSVQGPARWFRLSIELGP